MIMLNSFACRLLFCLSLDASFEKIINFANRRLRRPFFLAAKPQLFILKICLASTKHKTK